MPPLTARRFCDLCICEKFGGDVKRFGTRKKNWEQIWCHAVTPIWAWSISLYHPVTRLFWKTTRPNNVTCILIHLTIEWAFAELPIRYPVIVVYVRSHVFGISSISASSVRSEQVAAAIHRIENNLSAMWNWIAPSTYALVWCHPQNVDWEHGASDRLFERTRAGNDQAIALKVGCSPAGFLHGGWLSEELAKSWPLVANLSTQKNLGS